MTYTLAYNNHDMIVENALGTWSGERMKSTYVLLDFYGKVWAANAWQMPYVLYNLQSAMAQNLVARNITGIGGADSYYGADWSKSGVSEGTLLTAVANAFTSTTSGANLCYRYQDGVPTTQALWPWPMNQRIIDATLQSGRAAVDVTASIEKMLGTIPGKCKGTTVLAGPAPTTPAPAPMALNAPVNLRVTP